MKHAFISIRGSPSLAVRHRSTAQAALVESKAQGRGMARRPQLSASNSWRIEHVISRTSSARSPESAASQASAGACAARSSGGMVSVAAAEMIATARERPPLTNQPRQHGAEQYSWSMMERLAKRSKNSPPAGATSALRGAKKQLQSMETKALRLKRGAVLSVPRVRACARAALTNTKSAPQLFDELHDVVGQRPQGDQAARGDEP